MKIETKRLAIIKICVFDDDNYCVRVHLFNCYEMASEWLWKYKDTVIGWNNEIEKDWEQSCYPSIDFANWIWENYEQSGWNHIIENFTIINQNELNMILPTMGYVLKENEGE